jgi:flagellar biosynthesis repressor protein FlbT
MQISLRRGERLYINGAVIRPDRKVSIELLNDVAFLLENHVMQACDATTPLKQLYFVAQMLLMEANESREPLRLFDEMLKNLHASLPGPSFREPLESISKKVAEKRVFDALKIIRGLFPLEEEILSGASQQFQTRVA